jgi:glycosyltransferase involved in cell wall biosynthesis
VPPFRAIVVGEGPEHGNLKQRCIQLGLTSAVNFVGQQSQMSPWYDLADIFVLPSHSEGSPNVLLEAMCAGLPIIATSAGGIPEIVTHTSDALMVPTQDPSALATQIDRLLRDRSLRVQLGSAAAQRVTRYSPQAYCKSMTGHIQDVLTSAQLLPSSDRRVAGVRQE